MPPVAIVRMELENRFSENEKAVRQRVFVRYRVSELRLGVVYASQVY